MIAPAPPPPSFFTPPQWPQSPLHSGMQELESAPRPDFPLAKRQRLSGNEPSQRAAPPSNHPPVIKGINRMFFKTRICEKFLQGTCPYGSNCNFAHGVEEIRKPPPNWKEIVAAHDDRGSGNWGDNQRIINRLRLCRKFYNGEGCPYGDKCSFIHEDPEKVRESAAVTVTTNGIWPDHHSAIKEVVVMDDGILVPVVDNKVGSGNSGSDGKPFYWKTKICNKWEMTGHCPFGDNCHFAHGQAELHKFGGGHTEIETGNTGAAPSKPLPVSTNYSSPSKTTPLSNQPTRAIHLAKLNGPGLISRVYADWIDDLELS